MRIRLSLKPGQKGTKRLQDRYGDRLVCVRYRYDEESGKRFKTVELIVEEADWCKPSRWSDRGAEGGLERITGPERGQEGWREMESFGAGVGDPI